MLKSTVELKKGVIDILRRMKKEKFSSSLPSVIPVYNSHGEIAAFLRPISSSTLKKPGNIKLLASWRDENSFAFPTQFKVTYVGTRKWTRTLLKNQTRILFFVQANNKKKTLVGHIGLSAFDFKEPSCEIDNVVRGNRTELKGVMTYALESIILWARNYLKINNIYLRVLNDNTHAIKFYIKNKFVEVERLSLNDEVRLRTEVVKFKKKEKHFIRMKLLENKRFNLP